MSPVNLNNPAMKETDRTVAGESGEKSSGVVVLVSPYDVMFGKGAIASVRHFAPEIPLLALVDGDVDLTGAEAAYGVKIQRTDAYDDPWLGRHAHGFGVSKMGLFWDCPFERFLYFDSDAVLWGDPTQALREMNADVVIDIPDHPGKGPNDAYRWFFDPKILARYFPEFEPQPHWREFFCTGTFMSRKNIIPRDFYQSVFDLRAKDPLLFKSRGEMGMLNFMLFYLSDKGGINLQREDIQTLFTEYPQDQMLARFPLPPQPPLSCGRLGFRILHMPDHKPFVDTAACYSKPMTWFRLKYLEDTQGITGNKALDQLKAEDAQYHILRSHFLAKDRLTKIARLLSGNPGEWRRTLNRFTSWTQLTTQLSRTSPHATARQRYPEISNPQNMNPATPSQGVIVVTCPYDWLFAKGTVASLRHFMPDLPVCLLIDGKVDTSLAEEMYGVTVLRREDIPDPWLRRHSFGWGFTKMNAVWHSPYERFMHLDADTVVWGDVRAKVFPEDGAIAWPFGTGPGGGDAETYVDSWFFNPQKIEHLYPDFRWRELVSDFACTGVFGMTRGCLDKGEYQLLRELGQSDLKLFGFGEMGLLNLMIFRNLQAGSLDIRRSDFQIIFPDHPISALRDRFRFKDGQPLVVAGDEQVLHMPDYKPLIDNSMCYSEPMTYFRLQYLNATQGLTGTAAMARLRQEDADYHRLRAKFLRHQRNAKVMSLLRGHPGEWRKLLEKLKIIQ